MKPIRVAGIIPMEDGFAFMHRQHVQNHPIGDYYAFLGGHLEEGESLEEGTVREIKEETGIDVKVVRELYHIEKETMDEYFFLCEYVGGEFGIGDGPEYSNDPKYIARGTYTPEIVKRDEVKNITLLPPEIKEKFVKDLEKNNI